MKRGSFLAVAVLASFAASGCGRHPKIATAASAADVAPTDPIAKVEAERLAKTVVADGPLNDPRALANVCVEARVACGFELRDGVWDRPETRTPLSNATAVQALNAFMGSDYRLAWIGPVAHVFPVRAGPMPLDAEVAADVSLNSPSAAPEKTIHDVAVKTGLEMPDPRPRDRRKQLLGASSLTITNSARYVLDVLTRPALLHPSPYVAVYGPDRAGSLRWYWGEPPAW